MREKETEGGGRGKVPVLHCHTLGRDGRIDREKAKEGRED